jgi:hypothetical protein
VPVICPYPEPTPSSPHDPFYGCLILPLETLPPPLRRSEWGSSLPPDCYVSRGSISTWVILNIRLLRRGIVSTSPNPQAGGPPLVGCPRLFIQFIHSYSPYRRPFLHPQHEDAPCRGASYPIHSSCIYVLKHNLPHVCGPGSSVGITTGYGLDGPEIVTRWGRDFPHLSRPTLRPTQSPVQWVPDISQR